MSNYLVKPRKRNKCFYCLLLYMFLALLAGWLPYLLHKFQIEDPVLYKSNWNKDMISDLIIVDSVSECPEEYSSMLDTWWPGIREGCATSKRLCYEDSDSVDCFEKCSTLDPVPPKNLTAFALSDKSYFQYQQDSKLDAFKLCGKKLKGVNLYSFNSTQRFYCGKQEKQCFEDGKFFCVHKRGTCQINNILCKEKETLCTSVDRVLCVPQLLGCLSNFSPCTNQQKICYIKEYTICIDQSEQCPITDLVIQSRFLLFEPNSSYKKVPISISPYYNLFIQRNNPEGYPVVEFKIAGANGVCLNYEEDSVFYGYYLDRRKVCSDEEKDERFAELLNHKLKAVDLYDINNIDVGNHRKYIPGYDEYKVYFKKYLPYQNHCYLKTGRFDSIVEDLEYIRERVCFLPIFTTLIITVLFLIISFNENKKRHYFIYIYSALLFLSFFAVFYLTLSFKVSLDFNIFESLDYFKSNNCFDNLQMFYIDRFYQSIKATSFFYEMAFYIYLFPGLMGLPTALTMLFILIKLMRK